MPESQGRCRSRELTHRDTYKRAFTQAGDRLASRVGRAAACGRQRERRGNSQLPFGDRATIERYG